MLLYTVFHFLRKRKARVVYCIGLFMEIMIKFVKYLLTIMLFAVYGNIAAQTDTEFWFAAPDITYRHGVPGGQPALLNITASGSPANVVVAFPANAGVADIKFSLAPGEFKVLQLHVNPGMANVENHYNIDRSPNGIHITSDNDITAYYEIDNNWNRDIFSLKGKNSLGTSFLIPAQNQWRNPRSYAPDYPYSGFNIIATQDNTQVRITPSKDAKGSHNAGVTYTVTLDKGEVHTVEASSNSAAGHLGGSVVTSDKPVAISVYDDSMKSPAGCADMMGDQIVPIGIAGREYIVMRGLLGKYDLNPIGENVTTDERIFIMPVYDNTNITISDGAGDNVITGVNSGQTVSEQITHSVTRVLADKPVYVTHVTGFGCEMGGAILPTVDGCTGSSSVSFTRTKSDPFFLNIMVRGVRSGQRGFEIVYEDGTVWPIPEGWFEKVTGSDWYVLRKERKRFQGTIPGGIPLNQVVTIRNSNDVFHLGIINGTQRTGCKYGYFSDYSATDVTADVGFKGMGEIGDYCSTDPVHIVLSGGLSYEWIATGAASDLAYLSDPYIRNPIGVFPKDGTYEYNCKITRACKVDTTVSVTINILKPSRARFKINSNTICAPEKLQIENESDNADPTKYKWFFDFEHDKVTFDPRNDANFEYYLPNDGATVKAYKVRLVTESPEGCPDAYERTIVVNPKIEADFTQDVVAGCNPLDVQFTDASTGDLDPNQYTWDFGDGTTSYEQSPKKTFVNNTNADVTYTAKLKVESPYHCISEKTVDITVNSFIDASYTVNDINGCAPYDLKIKNDSRGDIKTIEWNFGDGTPVSNNPAPNFTYTYNNTTPNPKVFPVNLKITNTAGCVRQISRDITVYPEVRSDFAVDKNIGCDDLDVAFTNNSFGYNLSYVWEFGDGGTASDLNTTHIYNNKDVAAEKVYTAKLTTTSTIGGCSATHTEDITVHKYVKSNFTINTGSNCTPFNALIENSTIGGDRFEWEFGDGKPDETKINKNDFYHEYDNADPDNIVKYKLKLTASNAGQCPSITEREVEVYPRVKAELDALLTSNCAPVDVEFNNISTGGALNFVWEFGDGQSSKAGLGKLDHTFENRTAAPIIFNTKLTATNPHGCTDVKILPITANPQVISGFTFAKIDKCTPADVEYSNTSLNGTKFTWEMGDGTLPIVKTDKTPFNHIFNNPTTDVIKTYTVKLTAEDVLTGCKTEYTSPIEIYPKVVADFTVDKMEGCNPVDITFTNASTGLATYKWDFGDLSTSTEVDPVHSYSNFGTVDESYKVVLEATNAIGCKDTKEQTVTVYPYVKADFDIDNKNGCSPLDVKFVNYSKNNVSNAWEFGDGRTSNKIIPDDVQYVNNSVPLVNNKYTIKLTVSNAHGCSASKEREVIVFPRTVPDFDFITEGCHPLKTVFTNLTEHDSGTKYSWRFGDGSQSYDENPTKTFYNYETSVDKKYTIWLRSESKYTCADSIKKEITIHPKPKAKIELPELTSCPPFNATINNSSLGTGLTYKWDFGDGTSNTTTSAAPIAHEFVNTSEATKMYTIKLKAESAFGCSDEVTDNVFVYARPVVDFTMNATGCSPMSVDFVNKSNSVADYYLWDFNDLTTSTVVSPTHRFENFTGTDKVYSVKLKGNSKYNCASEITKDVTVFATPIAEFSVSPVYKIFPDANFVLTNLTTPGSWDLVWNFGDGTESKRKEKSFGYKYSKWAPNDKGNIYTISLDASNPDHAECKSTISHNVTLVPHVPEVNITNDEPKGCAPLKVEFGLEHQWAEEFLWDFGDGETSTDVEPTHTFTKPGIYYVSVKLKGDGGESTDFKTVTVHSVPKVNFEVSPRVVMLPDERVKCFNLSEFAHDYTWRFGDGKKSTTRDADHLYTEVGVYDITLVAENNKGCIDSLIMREAVEVKGGGFLKFPNAFIPDINGSNGGEFDEVDYQNKVFHPRFDGVRTYKLLIYNKSGELIFETDDVNIGWDGYKNGKLCDQGVYVWRAKGKYNNGKQFDMYGDVTLIR